MHAQKENYFYLDRYEIIAGLINPLVDDYVYQLPFANTKAYRLIQGYENPRFTHNGIFSYSLDFFMEVGTEIHAARDGWVIAVIENFDGFGLTPDYQNKTNYVEILHSDGTRASYAHCMKDGIVVNTGDFVETGDLIAYSGLVGYSGNTPHLHLDIRKYTDFNYRFITIKTLFYTKSGTQFLVEGQTYQK